MPVQLIPDAAAVVWLAGEDRLDYLHRMSTNRLNDLANGAGRATAVLSDAGRVVDLVGCYAGADGNVLITSTPAAATPVTDHLRRYVVYGDRVRVTNAAAQVTVLRLLGDPAAVFGVVASATGLDLAATGALDWLMQGEGDDEVWVLRHPAPPGGLGGADVVVPAGDAAAAMTDRLVASGATVPVEAATSGPSVSSESKSPMATTPPASASDAWRVRLGVSAFGAEIDGLANPLELGLKGLVDFDKGCYIGQEVVARLDTYAKVQRRLVRLTADGPLAVGDSVTAAQPDGGKSGGRRDVGKVTTAGGVDSREATWSALALVPAAWVGAQTVMVKTAAAIVPAALTPIE